MGKTLCADFQRYLRNFHGIYFAHTFMNPEISETVSVFETPDELIPTRATLDIGGKWLGRYIHQALGYQSWIFNIPVRNKSNFAKVPVESSVCCRCPQSLCHTKMSYPVGNKSFHNSKKNNWEDNSQAIMLVPFPCLFWENYNVSDMYCSHDIYILCYCDTSELIPLVTPSYSGNRISKAK